MSLIIPLRRLILIVSAVGTLLDTVYGQTRPDSAHQDVVFEDSILEMQLDEPSGHAEILLDRRAKLAENPVDINRATTDQLASVPGISGHLAQRIIRFRSTFGDFNNISELRAVRGISDRKLRGISLYVTVRQHAITPSPESGERIVGPLDRWSGEILQRLERPIDIPSGYIRKPPDNRYLGSPYHLYLRTRLQYREQAAVNLTLDNDAGEPLRWAPNESRYGPDFVSGHLELRDVGLVRRLVLGDYLMQTGQGLVFWPRAMLGKGANVVDGMYRESNELDPYGSSGENQFFRGMAAELGLGQQLVLTGFHSRRELDASPGSLDSTGQVLTVRGMLNSGLHRTPGEAARKDLLRNIVTGGTIRYDGEQGRLGISGYHATYEPTLDPGPADYRRFYLSGGQLVMGSLSGQLIRDSHTLYGEVGRDADGTLASTAGAIFHGNPNISSILAIRIFPPEFTSPFGFALGERSGSTTNEYGIYLGVQVDPSDPLRLKAYLDQYTFPWIRYRLPRPSRGWEGFLSADYEIQERVDLQALGTVEKNQEYREYRQSPLHRVEGLTSRFKHRGRLQLTLTPSPALRFRTRVEGVRIQTANAPPLYGRIAFQDIRIRPVHQLRLDARFSLFATDEYASRIFTYENDLLYRFHIPSFFHRGYRTYILLSGTIGTDLLIQLKYGQTVYFNRNRRFGTGLNQRPGNRARDLRLQLRWTW